jgi:hypothetical protein
LSVCGIIKIAIFRRRNTDHLLAKCLIRKSLIQNAHFPYTSQYFSIRHKSEKISNQAPCSVFVPLLGRARWAYRN